MVLWIHASSTMCSNVFKLHDTFASARHNRHTEAGKFDVQTRLSFYTYPDYTLLHSSYPPCRAKITHTSVLIPRYQPT